MPIRAAIFDMDGLLLDSERLYREAFLKAARGLGVEADDATYAALIGLGRKSSQDVLRGRYGPDADALDAAWSEGVVRLMAAPIPLRPGARTVLRALHGALPLAVATSTKTGEALRRLEAANLLPFFETVVGAGDVARTKPAPDLYLLAAERLGTAPADCAAFEDSANGTRAALAAGMRVVQVPDLVDADPSLGQVVAADLIAGARALGLTVEDAA